MRSDRLVEKMIYEHKEQIKFLEEYYTEKNGFPTYIVFSWNQDTSSYSKPRIKISNNNLMTFMEYDQVLTRPLFYTLLMHEMGHAIYTQGLPYSEIANVIEDNRIEYQIEQWNARVNFNLMRYIYQDKLIQERASAEQIMLHKPTLALALLRTLDNRKYYNLLSYTKERKNIVNEILRLHEQYKHLDYKYDTATLNQRLELEGLITQIDTLIDLLIDMKKQEQEQPQPQPQQQGQEQEQDNEQQAQDTQTQQALDQALDDLSNLKQESTRMQGDVDYDTPILYNRQTDTEPYTKHKITAFDTQRRHGIKGSGSLPSSSGNAKQLNMQRYMRRNIVSNEKLFDKQSNFGRGGKAARAVFFLDISGSMSGDYIRIASDYLKSFYDTMHNHMEIRLFGFGSTTFKISRNELNLSFLENNLQGSTRLDKVKILPNEEIIVITDGQIGGTMPEQVKRKAHFVIIDENKELKTLYDNYIHKTFVRLDNIAQGLDQATQGIKKLLQG